MRNNNCIVYIVLQSSHIGGAEKRFLELWNFFQDKGINNILLIIPKSLYKKVIQIPSLSHNMKYSQELIVLDVKTNRYREFFYKMLPIIFHAPKDSIFHYPLTGFPFIHTLLRQKMIISMVNSTYFERKGSVLFKGKLLFKVNALLSYKIDVLNPKIYENIKKSFFLKNKTYLTQGSMVEIQKDIVFQRENKIVFIGRFDINDIKNVLKYASMIPAIHRYLLSQSIQNIKYYILGHGVLEEKLKALLEDEAYQGIDIECYFEINPLSILKNAKVMLSLQKYENYPSRSLLEAMSLGVIPIVTDVGESHLFENKDIIQYISKDFTTDELAYALQVILKLDSNTYYKKAKVLSAYVGENHSIENHARYFLNLYGIK